MYCEQTGGGDDLFEISLLEQIDFLLRRINKRMNRIVLDYGRAHGITPTQYLLLLTVLERPGVSVSEAARVVGISKSNASSIAERLSAAGVLQRRRDETDARLLRLYLAPGTEEDLRHRLLALHRSHLAAILQELSAAETDQLRQALQLLANGLDRAAQQGGQAEAALPARPAGPPPSRRSGPRPGAIQRIEAPTFFPIGPVNCYLIEGDPLTLIDFGPPTPEAQAALSDGLQRLGYRPADLQLLVLSHSHVDHLGLAPWLVAESGASLLVPRGEYWQVVDGPGEWRRRAVFLRDFLLGLGVPETELAASTRRYDAAARSVGSVAVSGTLDEGDVITMGGAEWQVLTCPGHSVGHLVFYCPASGELIAGDHLLRDVSSNPLLEAPARGAAERPRSLVRYLHSLRRVAELEVAVVYPGHGLPFSGHRNVVAERIRLHETRKEQLRELVLGGVNTVYDLGKALFPQHGQELFLVLSEVIGHLDLLEEEGELVIGPVIRQRSGKA